MTTAIPSFPSRYTSPSSERFIRRTLWQHATFWNCSQYVLSPEGILMSSCLMLPVAYQPRGKDTENLMNLRKAVQASLLEEAWGRGKQTERKRPKKLHCPQGWHLQRAVTGTWRHIIFLVPIYLQGWFHYCGWPLLGQRWREKINIRGKNTKENMTPEYNEEYRMSIAREGMVSMKQRSVWNQT